MVKAYEEKITLFQSNLRGMETPLYDEDFEQIYKFQSNLRGMETTKRDHVSSYGSGFNRI